MRILRHQAERGSAEAMTCLAVDQMDLQNFDEATRWFRKAAELGFPGAQVMLGSAYESGKGVEKDIVEAVRLVSSSCRTRGPFSAKHYRGNVPHWRWR